MSTTTADVVICGAGIAGVAAAYFLATDGIAGDIVLVDERAPLTLTSDKSTEAYRNWWPGPGPTMVRFTNRSIDLLERFAEESDNQLRLNRRGYVYLAADPANAERLQATAQAISVLGGGPLRIHPGPESYQPHAPEAYRHQPIGADLLLGSDLIRQHFPFLTADVTAALHTRRCGWLSAQQLGMYLLEKARSAGVRFLAGRVQAVALTSGRVTAVRVDNQTIATPVFVNAAGPFVGRVAAMLHETLPVHNELHRKIAFHDVRGIVPRDVPMMIWDEPLEVPWSAEERAELAGFDETRPLVEPLPAGLHFRPEGGTGSPVVLMLWPYHTHVLDPVWPPPPVDEFFVEVTLRGMARMIPALACYLERFGRPYIDSGYYCKTKENRPLIGPMATAGAYVIGALSGYGIMAAPAAGELLAAHIAGAELPPYAPAFAPSRYEDAAYQDLLTSWPETGQL